MSFIDDPEFWLKRSMQALGGLLGLGLIWVALATVLPPPVGSVLPSDSLLADPAGELVMTDDPAPMPSFDFVDRPLFRADRRPAPALVMESGPAPKSTRIKETEKLEGFSLTGVFSSGAVQGVMLRSEEGDRIRVTLGDTLEGLTLRAVDARSAVFGSADLGDPSEVRLSMVLASIPMPSPVATDSAMSRESFPGDTPSGDDEPVVESLAFDSIYASRAEKKAARLARNQAIAERLLRGNGAAVDNSEKDEVMSYAVDN